MKQKQGFTLIELLVVIAVIGMLASIVLVSLGPARQKARDARRVADVRNMSTGIEVEAATGVSAMVGCTGADVDADTCSGPGAIDFAAFQDPTTPGSPCANGTSATCQYSISQADGGTGATTGDYQICFWLESGAGSLAAGLHSIEANGVFTNDCTL